MLLPSTEHDQQIRFLLDRSIDLAARADKCGKDTAIHSKRLGVLHRNSALLIDYCEQLGFRTGSRRRYDEAG